MPGSAKPANKQTLQPVATPVAEPPTSEQRPQNEVADAGQPAGAVVGDVTNLNLLHLLKVLELTSDQFKMAVGTISRSRGINVPRYIDRHLDCTKQFQGGTCDVYSAFAKTYHVELTREHWASPTEVFVKEVEMQLSRDKRLVFQLSHAMPTWTDYERQNLPGAYQVYRYSFRNDGSVALEWLVIEDIGADHFMNLTLISVSPDDQKGKPSGSPEEFRGRLFRVEDHYFAVLDICNQSTSRLRHIELGALPRANEAVVHLWALIGGVGAKTGRPSCASAVAERRGDATLPRPPDAVRFDDISRVPVAYRDVVENNILTCPVNMPR